MKRLLVALAFTFLLPASGWAQWTHRVASDAIVLDDLLVCQVEIQFLKAGVADDAHLKKFNYQTIDDLDAQIKAQVVRYEKIDTLKIVLPKKGDVISVTPAGPTADEVARNEFIVLLKDYLSKKAVLAAGVSKTVTQEVVDAAYAALKVAYKDEYAELCVGVF